MNNQNGKRTVAIIFYLIAFVWTILAISNITDGETSTSWISYLSTAGVWFCIGSIFMAQSKSQSKTINYYDDHAAEFVANTENADVSELRNRFLKYLPDGGYILDWGCGSGRDTIAFLQAGYQVDATDGSDELATLASEKTGINVGWENFDNLDEREKYDGIWACSSLLHVEFEELPETFGLAEVALKTDGVMYASFKYGDFEGERNGRFFTDMTEERFAMVIKDVKKLSVEESWITTDVRPGRREEKWLNIILRKSDTN